MERLSYRAEEAFTPRDDLLDGVTIAPLTAPLTTEAPVQAAIFRFGPNGRIARHPAGRFPQILAVLEGAGEVSGADGELQPIAAGDAVFWSAGEEHEVKTEDGLTALILEADGIEPFRRRSVAAGRPGRRP